MPFDLTDSLAKRSGGSHGSLLVDVVRVYAKRGILHIGVAHSIVVRKKMEHLTRVQLICGSGKDKGKILISPELSEHSKFGRSWRHTHDSGDGTTRRARYVTIPLEDLGYNKKLTFSPVDCLFLEEDPRGIVIQLPPK